MKKMAAGLFKVHCLAVMDEVQAKRHGKPVAKLVPADKNIDDIYKFLAGKGAVTGDVVSLALSEEEWGELKCGRVDKNGNGDSTRSRSCWPALEYRKTRKCPRRETESRARADLCLNLRKIRFRGPRANGHGTQASQTSREQIPRSGSALRHRI